MFKIGEKWGKILILDFNKKKYITTTKKGKQKINKKLEGFLQRQTISAING